MALFSVEITIGTKNTKNGLKTPKPFIQYVLVPIKGPIYRRITFEDHHYFCEIKILTCDNTSRTILSWPSGPETKNGLQIWSFYA